MFPYVCCTVWTTQRCSQSYTEKRRGRKETEVARRIKGGIKRREREIQPVIRSLSVLHSEEHPERFTELHGEEKRKEGVRGDPNEMRWNQKEERAS